MVAKVTHSCGFVNKEGVVVGLCTLCEVGHVHRHCFLVVRNISYILEGGKGRGEE